MDFQGFENFKSHLSLPILFELFIDLLLHELSTPLDEESLLNRRLKSTGNLPIGTLILELVGPVPSQSIE